MLACTDVSLAKEAKGVPPPAKPIGSATDWISSDDYPAVAVRLNMEGTTAIALAVDASGKPSRCDIVESSGFDVLDEAACNHSMTNASFSPVHDNAGKPTESQYNTRIKWVLPTGPAPAVSEDFITTVWTIDQTGLATSCRLVFHGPSATDESEEMPCEHEVQPAPKWVRDVLGDYQGPSAVVELRQADVFTPELRERVLSPKPGYEQRWLNVYRFTVTKDGKLDQCSYLEQRGSPRFAGDYCGQARTYTYDPPFSAFDSNGVATGWHITRALLKVDP